MKLYIGGAYQGQEKLARQENPDAQIIEHFHLLIRETLEKGEDPAAFAKGLCNAFPQAVVTADEIGCGIVPIDAGDRAWREAVGRALCIIAGYSDQVIRVVCGIGVRIK